MLGSVVESALKLSAPAFVAGMLMVYVHGDALIPGSALSAAIRMVNSGGRAIEESKTLPGSAEAAIRTAAGSGVKIVCTA